jgi:hypothetical protein
MAEINLSFSQILRRGFEVALVVFILTFVIGVFFTWRNSPEVYVATAVIEVSSFSLASPSGTTTAGAQPALPPDVFLQRMESPFMLQTIIENSTVRQILGDQTSTKEPLTRSDPGFFEEKPEVHAPSRHR